MDIRLIALDLDGTLLNSQKHISSYTRQLLEATIADGIRVVIATGRARAAIPQEVMSLRGLQYMITSNGSSIFALPDFERIYARDMTPVTIRAILDILSGYSLPFEAFIAGAAYTSRSYYDDPTAFGVPARMHAYVRQTRHPVASMTDFVLAHLEEIEGMDIIAADQNHKAAITRRLSAIPDLYITSSESFYIELAAGSVSKASALLTLAKQLSVKPSQIIAFGDGGNDLELLQCAGWGVAMKNAAPLLRDAADDVTLSNDEDGIACYLEKYLTRQA